MMFDDKCKQFARARALKEKVSLLPWEAVNFKMFTFSMEKVFFLLCFWFVLKRYLFFSFLPLTERTAFMKANIGRAAYVNEAYITQPDAGAQAVAICVQALLDNLFP